MNHIVPVKQYTSAAEMMAGYAAIRRKFRTARQPVVLQIEAVPEPERAFISTSFEQARRQRELDRRMFAAFDDYERQQAIKAKKAELLESAIDGVVRIPIEFIMRQVSLKYNIPVVDIKSERRTRVVIIPSHEYCWLAQKITTLSLPQIGKTIGKRDHTTVLSAIRRTDERIAARPQYGVELNGFVDLIRRLYLESLSQ